MEQFEIEVPTELGDKNLIPFFKGWTWGFIPRGKGVRIDFTKVEFTAPWAINLFAAHALWLKEQSQHDVNVLVDHRTIAGRYLVQAGIIELLGSSRPDGIPDPLDSRMAPLKRIRKSEDVPAFASSVMNLLQIEDEELEGAVRYGIVELLRNVVQHSSSAIGGTAMAQYYPKTGLVEVTVADSGIGVLNSLRPRYPEITTDLTALKFALLPHVSGTFGPHAYASMSDNAGLGLFFIKEIATRSGGGFFLGSGNALVDLWGNQDGTFGKKYQSAIRGGWPGTFALLQLRRDSIAEFGALLGVCRDLAAEARRDPTEIALDFVDEVPDIPGLVVVKVAEFEEDVDAAARNRDAIVSPALQGGKMVVMDFKGIKAATQSFAHACMYKVLRDRPEVRYALSIAGCSNATREAIRAVAAYAKVDSAGTNPFSN